VRVTPELLFAVVAAGANIAGALAVTSRTSWSVKALDTMLAFAAGFMVSVALGELLPEALSRGGTKAAGIVLAGYLAVHLTQHTLTAHFHFGEETHAVTQVVSVGALAGLLLHTIVDGVAIASGFHAGTELGILVFGAVLLHKLPEGLAISSLFLAAGAGRGKALGAAAALGLATIAGTLLTDAIPYLAEIGLPLAAGVTLYVAASNLVPEVQSRRELRGAVSFFLGAGAFLAARMILDS
jgi:zinc and cadmium transporter